MTGAVAIREVLPRDGLQDIGFDVPTAVKVAIVERLWRAGLRWIEVTSFVHPRWVPQFADAVELLAAVRDLEGLEASAFVPNRRGFDLAVEYGADEVSLVVASTNTLSERNFAMSRTDALDEITGLIVAASDAGVCASVTVGGAFGCPFEGEVAVETVVELAERLAAAGPSSLFLADTIGVGTPEQVGALTARVRDAVGDLPLGLHLHGGDAAVAGVLSGVAAGATVVDAATAGFGGCPFVPSAPGNVSTEHTLAALAEAGSATDARTADVLAASHDIRRLLDEVNDHAAVPTR